MKKVLVGLFVAIIVILGAAVGGGYVYIYQPYLTTTASTKNLQKIMAPEETFLLHSMNLKQFSAIDEYVIENKDRKYKFSPVFGKMNFLEKSGLNLKTQATSLTASVLIPKEKLTGMPTLTFGVSGNFPASKIIKNLNKHTLVTPKEHNGIKYYEYKHINKIDCRETGPFAVYITDYLLIQSSPELITFWIDRAKAGKNLKTADLTQFNKYQELQLVTTQLIGLKKMMEVMGESPQFKMFGKKDDLSKLNTVFLTAGIDIENKALSLNLSILANGVDAWQTKSMALKKKAKLNNKNFEKEFPGFYGIIDAFYAKLNNDVLKLGVNIDEAMLENLKLLPEEFVFFALSGFDPSKATPSLANKAKKIIEKLVPEKDQFKFKPSIKMEDFGKVTQYDNRPVYQYLNHNLGLYISEIEMITNEQGEEQLLYKMVMETKNKLDYPSLPHMLNVYIEDTLARESKESIISDFHCGIRSAKNPFKFSFSKAEKEILIKANIKEEAVDIIKGRADYKMPETLAQIVLSAKDVKKAQKLGNKSTFILTKLKDGGLSYSMEGNHARLYKVRALNKEKKPLKKGPFSSFGFASPGNPEGIKKTDLNFAGQISFVEITYVKTFKTFSEKFEIPAKLANLKSRVIKDESKAQTYSLKKYKKSFSTKKKVVTYKKIKMRRGKRTRKKRITKYIESWKPLTAMQFPIKDKKYEIEGIEVYLTSLGSFHVAPKFKLRTHMIPELAGSSSAIGIEFHSVTMKDGNSYGPITAEESLLKDDFGRPLFRGGFGTSASWKSPAKLKSGFFIKDVFEGKVRVPLGRTTLKPQDLKSFKASLFFHFPTKIESLLLENFDIHSTAGSDDFSLTVVKKKEGKIYFKINGDFEKYLGAKVYNIAGETIDFDLVLAPKERDSVEELYTLETNGQPVRIEVNYGVEFEDKSYPFEFVNE